MSGIAARWMWTYFIDDESVTELRSDQIVVSGGPLFRMDKMPHPGQAPGQAGGYRSPPLTGTGLFEFVLC